MPVYNIQINTSINDEFGIDREKHRTGNDGVQTKQFLEDRINSFIASWVQTADSDAMDEIGVAYRDGNDGKKQAIRGAAGVT